MHKRQIRKNLLPLFGICVGAVLLAAAVTFICFRITRNVESTVYYIEHPDKLEKKDLAIVPGTAVVDGLVTAKCMDRLNGAIALYEQGLVQSILVSGSGEEAQIMSAYLVKNGIPVEAVVADMQGFDTYDTLARAKKTYGDTEVYVCTQELYAPRTSFLMEKAKLTGNVLCCDTRFYAGEGKQRIREYLAATKAVYEGICYGGEPKNSVEERDFWTVKAVEEDESHIHPEDLQLPDDYRLEDVNAGDGYDVEKAVAYAQQYAYTHNADYPTFEQNCTNFVSQCLAAGGIAMEGEPEISKEESLTISGDDTDWYSIGELSGQDDRMHYGTSKAFISTDAFVEYFTERRGYKLSTYVNNYDGKLQCYNEMACGDIMLLYDEDGNVAHIGIISGLGYMNAYFCANTNSQLNYCVFNVNDKVYPKFGIIHMSGL